MEKIFSHYENYSEDARLVKDSTRKIERGTGIEMAEVLPGFAMKFDIQDLIKCIAPRQILLTG